MTRREAIAVSLASPFCFGPNNRWISIAGPAVNRAGRRYSESALRKMQASIVPGTSVYAQPGEETYPNLADLLGVVTESRIIGLIVDIRIDWLEGKKPMQLAHACPWGRASINEDGVIGEDYEFEAIAVSPLGSYFHEATPV